MTGEEVEKYRNAYQRAVSELQAEADRKEVKSEPSNFLTMSP